MFKIDTYDPRFSTMKKMQKNGKNSSTVLQDNRNLLLQLIREYGAVSRKQLSEKTGLQQATVTIIIQELLEQGLIQENGMMDGGNGRRVKAFSMAEEFYVVSIRLTGAYIKLALYDIRIQSTHIEKIFFQTDDYITEAIEIILEYLAKVEKVVEKTRILGVALGVEHIYRLLENDYYVWDEKRKEYCPIGKRLHDLTKYRVFSNRGINFSSYDVWNRYKVHNHIKNEYAMMINMQLSYDLESAIIVNGELLYGMEGMCGYLGNMQIDKNSGRTYKDVATVPALLKRSKELIAEFPKSCIADIKKLNIRDVVAGYEKGDELCLKVYNEVSEHLGFLIAQFINWLDPDVVFLSDETPQTNEFILKLKEETAKYCDENKVERISNVWGGRVTKNDPGLIGGAKYVFDLIISDIGIYN